MLFNQIAYDIGLIHVRTVLGSVFCIRVTRYTFPCQFNYFYQFVTCYETQK